jgi:hypothetical protein
MRFPLWVRERNADNTREGAAEPSPMPNTCRNQWVSEQLTRSGTVRLAVYKTAAQPAFVARRPPNTRSTDRDGRLIRWHRGAVTTATGSYACSRRTPGWGTQIRAAEAPHPGPGRLGAALTQPQLNHAEQHRGHAALRPGRGANAPTWPDAGSSRSSRQPQRYLRPLP